MAYDYKPHGMLQYLDFSGQTYSKSKLKRQKRIHIDSWTAFPTPNITTVRALVRKFYPGDSPDSSAKQAG